MDAEPYDNAYKFGGLTKGAYVKKRIKELRKAAQGEEVKNNETNISPRGTIDSPAGFTSPEKNLASVIKQNANEAMLKQQAENEYQQYQNSTMGQDFNGKFLFGGRNRRIRRANRAMFGTPTILPGVDVNYEFGLFGGLKKAEARWDLDAIGDLAKLLPGAMNMMPGMFPGMMPGMMSYKKVTYPAQVRKKTISTINNAALDEVAKQNPNSTAAQNNRSDKKNEIKCPPGAVYDPSLGHCVDQEGNRVRSIIDLPDPEELLGNPFENPNARMLNGKKTMKATGPSSSASSNANAQSTQAPSAGGAPLQSEQALVSSSMVPVLNAQGQQLTSDASNMMYGQQGLPPVSPSAPAALEYPTSSPFSVPATSSTTVNDSPWSLASNATGSQTEEFCYPGQSCYNLSDDQLVDRDIFNDLPRALSVYGSKNKSSWLTDDEEGFPTNLDLSKVTKEEAKEAVKAQLSKNELSRIKNLDEYVDKWLKFQRENQKAYGNTNYSDLYDYDNPESPKYADWLNVSGKAGAQNPYDIFSATPVLDFQDYANGGPVIGVAPDQYGNLQKFIYGGDEYAYGGDVLPKAYDGYITNFQKQMESLKGRVNQMGTKNPVDVNPFAGNAFGKATTGIQPSGTVGNRFQPSGQPNTSAGIKQDSTPDNVQPPNRPRSTGFNPYTGQMMGDPNDPNAMAKYMQVMQMMQGQQGMGQGQFWTGRPQRLGFGLSRDFNWGTSYSPVNWQVPEGTKGIKQTMYKDRGKWWNPFDTKRITEWRIDNGEIVPVDPSKTQTQDKASTDETQDKASTNATSKDEPATDANEAINDNTKAPTKGFSQIPTSVSGQAPETMQSQGEAAVSSSNPYAGNPFSGNQFGSASTGIEPSGNLKPAQSPNDFTMSGQSNVSSNPFSGNAFGTATTGISGDVGSRPATPSPSYPSPGEDNPMADPKFVPTPQDYNPGVPPPSSGSNPAYTGEDGLDELPMAYGGYMNYGGYVPEYMAYGGYIPMAKPGIVVDKAEFSDPNLIGRTVENSAYTFKPGQLATDLFSGPTSLTGLTTNILNARDEAKKMDQAAQRNRTSDAATANTGQSGFGSAERKGSDLMASGNETQYGSTPGRQGYEGGLYGKKGGSMNTQYAKGKVYSLTMEQIKAIEAAGGKVEYIK
jgi:hypothetical protein